MKPSPGQPAVFEPLEERRLLAGVALAISTISGALGNILHIQGTAGNDRILVTNTSGGLLISNETGWSMLYTNRIAQIRIDGRAGNDRLEVAANIRTDAVLYGRAGVDTLVGGSGNDTLYGGEGRDYLYGNAGNDVLISLGDAAIDRLYGGAGFDSFWADTGSDEIIIDASPEETDAGAVHRVGSFMDLNFSNVGVIHPVPRTLGGQNLPDPTLTLHATGYQNFSTRPLFSRFGPRADDIYQGSLGDCYLLASLGSVAQANPQLIRDRIVDLGDGTYAVQFTAGSTTTYVRVDADLPVNDSGLAYAKLGRQGSLWAALIEKAYAFFRFNRGTYGSLESGFMGNVYGHLGLGHSSFFTADSGTLLLQKLQADLSAGRAVTFGTRTEVGDAPVAPAHAYMVDSVLTDSTGKVTHLRLRNPWGIDDTPGHGPDDGYILLTTAQAMQAFWFACSAVVK
jgi:hypothetical protein